MNLRIKTGSLAFLGYRDVGKKGKFGHPDLAKLF